MNLKQRHIKFIGDLSKQDVTVLIKYIRNASNILEFGVGGSTQIICKKKNKLSCFISLDTSQKWIDRTISNLQLFSIEPDVTFYLYENWEQSIDGKKFDLIFDDGVPELREDFALRAWQYLNINGSLLIHDTRTAEYIPIVATIFNAYYLEIDSILVNTHHSNITVITKKANEPYSNWNIDERKKPWEYGQGWPPKKIIRNNRLYKYPIGEEERVIITKLQVKGFFDDLSDEIMNDFCDKTFEYEFIRFLYEEKAMLKEELEKEIAHVKLISDINYDLKTKFNKAVKAFIKKYKKI